MIVWFLVQIINTVLGLFELCMIVRAVCSWIPSSQDSLVYSITFRITEPVLYPVRSWLFRFEWVRRCPIDLSFLAVILLLQGIWWLLSYVAVIFL